MVLVEVIDEHFTIGTTHHPKGEKIEVVDVVADYMEKNGKGKRVGSYSRRDMQAEQIDAEVMEAETKPKRKRGRPRKKTTDAA